MNNYELCFKCELPDCNRYDARCFYPLKRPAPKKPISREKKRQYNATYAARHPEKVREYRRKYAREYRKRKPRKSYPEYAANYRQSEKGKAARARYWQSEKGRAARERENEARRLRRRGEAGI